MAGARARPLPPAPLGIVPEASRAEPVARPAPVKAVRLAILEQSQVQGLAVALLFLSAGDLFMTFALLARNPAFFESNPIAHWFFCAGT